ncbi:MAG: hypothetical protein J5871_04610 [Bacteroidales bacterium]|nr:hypothetical protein [Bacteroidales bacterium]
MAYDIQLLLPPQWQSENEVYVDESGAEITHLEAHLYDAAAQRDSAMIDIYVGEMPADTTARDQSLSNYADIVGFDDEDPEDFDPVSCIRFNGKKAYVFEALCEDESPMMFLAQEVRQGVLAIICCAASAQDSLAGVVQLVERNLRVRG